jgi:hypothetical protein
VGFALVTLGFGLQLPAEAFCVIMNTTQLDGPPVLEISNARADLEHAQAMKNPLAVILVATVITSETQQMLRAILRAQAWSCNSRATGQ